MRSIGKLALASLAGMARGGKVAAIDGEVPRRRTILVSFGSFEATPAAFASLAYRDARKLGEHDAKFSIRAVEGVP